MRKGEIPDRFEPRRLLRESAGLRGHLATARMERLRAAVVDVAGEARLEAQVFRDDLGRLVVEGSTDVSLTLRCERCLEPMDCDVHADFRLAVVVSDTEAASLDSDVDPLLAEDGAVETAAMVEDELLLALPIVARHANMEECGVGPEQLRTDTGEAPNESSEDKSPFAALEVLKRRNQ